MNTAPISFENHLPRRVITGRGTSPSLNQVCLVNGWRQAFIVSDAGVAGAGLLRQVSLPLLEAHLLVDTFAEVPPEPPINVVDAIAERIRTCGADVVIALGGRRGRDPRVAAFAHAGGLAGAAHARAAPRPDRLPQPPHPSPSAAGTSGGWSISVTP